MIRIRVQGAAEALRRSGQMRDKMEKAIDDAVEYTAKEAVNMAKQNAPRRDGFLVNSIMIYRQESRKFSRTIGSDRPYARRQEYEHASKRGYFRKAMWNARNTLRERVNAAISELGG